MTCPITTHVLDLQLGKPAVGMFVRLQQLTANDFADIADGVTDADGRIMDLVSSDKVIAGIYRLRFETGMYFEGVKQPEYFYPSVTVEFRVTAARSHYHVPLLLSPFGYSTYRGS
jgi:5-hydroxyisourate hydrolase